MEVDLGPRTSMAGERSRGRSEGEGEGARLSRDRERERERPGDLDRVRDRGSCTWSDIAFQGPDGGVRPDQEMC